MHHNHKHGAAGNLTSVNGRKKPTPEYQAWINLRRRCDGRLKSHLRRYGERGIRVCARWRDFRNFLADMGPRPAGTSIDRIDNEGNYEPGNCRWATPAIQTRNRAPVVLNATASILIREMVRRGGGRSDVAHAFGVSVQLVGRVVRGERWRDSLRDFVVG